jgi:hypothetical protein
VNRRIVHYGCTLLASIGLATRSVHASPTIDTSDPRYEQVARLAALGKLPDVFGGFLPLTEHRLDTLLGAGTREPTAWWVAPLYRFTLRTTFSNARARNYSTAVRPRDLTGTVSLTCERLEGRVCGTGTGAVTEVEASAGYSWWLSASARVEATLGTDAYQADAALTRGYVLAESDVVAVELGRDAFALGPSVRTALGWGPNAPPLDQLRVSTARPLQIGSFTDLSGHYILGRLRAPQTYSGNLVSIVHGQIDIADRFSVGALQLLQLAGDGAPELGVIDFVLEHVRRRDASASEADSSNRRFGVDVSTRLMSLQGLRLYYAIVFEDIRRARWIDAVRYDADHLVGGELAALGRDGRHGVAVEWHKTGMRSHEHNPRTTGFTNHNFVVGAPLGPDAQSLYAGVRLAFDSFSLYPWLEVAQLSSDTYELIPYGPINRIAAGEDETRYRVGSRARVGIRPGLWVEAQAIFEHIDDFAFEPGRERNQGSITASIVWFPRGPLGTLDLN